MLADYKFKILINKTVQLKKSLALALIKALNKF